MANSIPEIAALLSEAQRKVLRAGSVNRLKTGASIMRHAKVRDRWPSRPNYREFNFLWEYGLPGKWGILRHMRLTPLGEQVRQHLMEQEGKRDGD